MYIFLTISYSHLLYVSVLLCVYIENFYYVYSYIANLLHTIADVIMKNSVIQVKIHRCLVVINCNLHSIYKYCSGGIPN